ncbi:MAG: hypothetical protein RIA71_03865 [Oceanicaulis sp.]
MDTVRSFLDLADPRGLKAALSVSPQLVDIPVPDGDHAPHPIHAVCDRVFDGRLSEADGLALAEVLISAGADLTHRHPGNGDSLVTTAISLAAPSIAHALLDAGAPCEIKGLFGARPLHWAAIMGMPDLLERLLPGADLTERDSEFASTPLGWALEGWASPPKGSQGGQIVCAAALVEAGAIVEAQWRESARVKQDYALSAALRL